MPFRVVASPAAFGVHTERRRGEVHTISCPSELSLLLLRLAFTRSGGGARCTPSHALQSCRFSCCVWRSHGAAAGRGAHHLMPFRVVASPAAFGVHTERRRGEV